VGTERRRAITLFEPLGQQRHTSSSRGGSGTSPSADGEIRWKCGERQLDLLFNRSPAKMGTVSMSDIFHRSLIPSPF
jgi:hypothetical protein